MNVNSSNYVELAVRTESRDFDAIRSRLRAVPTLRLLHGLMGLQTEVGEMVDALKKHLFYGKELNWENLIEEAGDLFWYLALVLDVLEEVQGITMDAALKANIEKLKARYPDRFTEVAALNRDLEAEMKALRGGLGILETGSLRPLDQETMLKQIREGKQESADESKG